MLNVATEIIDTTREQFFTAIDTFYENYVPTEYRRTYGYYDVSRDYFEITQDDGDTFGMRVGIVVDPNLINRYNTPIPIPFMRYHDPAEYVFERGFQSGIHGTKKIQVDEFHGSRYMFKFKEYYGKEANLQAIIKKHMDNIRL